MEVRHIERKALLVEKELARTKLTLQYGRISTDTFVFPFDLPEVPSVLRSGYLKLEVRPFRTPFVVSAVINLAT